MKSKKIYVKFKNISIIFILLSQLVLAACAPKPVTATRVTYQMSTSVTMQIKAVDAEKICDELVAALDDFERVASMYIATSDVARVNASANGEPVRVDERVYYFVEQAVAFGRESDGLFDVTIGSLTALWAINSENPSVPSAEDIEAARQLVDYTKVELYEEACAISVQEGQMLDPGGVAKGYALDLCRDILDRYAVVEGVISIGGNVYVYGDKSGEPYVVGIRYPEYASAAYFCALRLTDSIVSTTGGYERFFEADGVVYHHVLDPRTGYPANSGLVSVSVVHTNGLLADCLSTALYVGGVEYALERMRSGAVAAIIVDEDNNVYISKSLQGAVVDELSDTQAYTFAFV